MTQHIAERCELVRKAIEQREALRKADEQADAFRERAGEIKVEREKLDRALAKISVLRNGGETVEALPDPSRTGTLLQEYRDKLFDGPLEGGREYGDFKRALARLLSGLEDRVAEVLTRLKHEAPNIEEPFLRQVEAIPAYVEKVRHIREVRNQLRQGLELGSMSAQQLGDYLRKRDQLRELAAALDPAEFPKEVLEFFKAARHGAPLDKLTDPVREWLTERGQLKNLRLVIVDS